MNSSFTPMQSGEPNAARDVAAEDATLADVGALPYFAGLSPEECERASLALSPVEASDGEVVFAQNDEGGWIYLLGQGRVEIAVEAPIEALGSGASTSGGERRVLAILEAPALLGEMSVLLDEPRSAWATARGRCLLWQVSRESVRRALEEGEPWAQRLVLAMARILAARLAEMNRRVAMLAGEGALAGDPLHVLQQSLHAQAYTNPQSHEPPSST